MQLRPGDVVDDKYRLIRPLGRGGMGSVFVVEHMIVGRTMAMKVLHSWTDERDIERFKREARAATKIGSPHIVNVHDLGQLSDGTPYMVMEHLRGETLAQRLKARGRLGPTELAPIAVQMLDGLGAAHRIGIIHRDLKPDNVFLAHGRASAADEVKLLDFGVALSSTSTDGAHRLTRTGVVVGTPSYMSPEQACADQDLNARTDLYAVGVILYRALSGRLPFEAENMRSLMAKIIMGKAAPLSSLVPDADRAWVALITKAMARRPEDRFQSAAEFKDAVNRWISGHGRDDAPEPSITVPLNGPGAEGSEYQAIGSASPGAPPVRGRALRAIVLSAAALGVFAAALALMRFLSHGPSPAVPASRTVEHTDPQPQAAAERKSVDEPRAQIRLTLPSSAPDAEAAAGSSRSKTGTRRVQPLATSARGTGVATGNDREPKASGAPKKKGTRSRSGMGSESPPRPTVRPLWRAETWELKRARAKAVRSPRVLPRRPDAGSRGRCAAAGAGCRPS